MYNDIIIILKQWFIPPIHDCMVLMDCCQKNKYVINFTSDYMVSKFEVFVNHKLDTIYLTEIIIT